MAGLLGVANVANYVPNEGKISYVADSGATALTTSSWVLTATFATVLSVQPTVNFIWVFLAVYGVSASTVITTYDFTMTDGTTTVTIDNHSAPVAATATRGLMYGPFAAFNPGKDGGLAVATGISAVTATVVNSAGAQTATGRLYVLGYN